MQEHQNMFDYYDNKAAVYEKLQGDYLRDNKQLQRWAIGFIILIIVGIAITDSKWKTILLISSAVSAIQFVILFIDQSNRNFLMHAIDWLEAKDIKK